MITTSPSIVGDSFQLKNLVYGSIVGLWAGSIAHALFVRKEYLLRLDAYLNNEKTMDDKLKEQFAREYQVNHSKSAGSINPPFQTASTPGASVHQQTAPPSAPAPSGPSALVDINNDPEETIASLPGVGVILAKKALGLRLSKNSFKSIEEFAEGLGLKPHIVEQLRPLVVINPLKDVNEDPGTPGRIIDY
ncbi:ComEA family DNA-binding protein [Pelotomaculum propionicicum]|uniref:ComEA family DNA-binding protein n=1 Tax=Pelotomaculum propionicicum TaxID=258475 RepID=UPI003B7E7A84